MLGSTKFVLTKATALFRTHCQGPSYSSRVVGVFYFSKSLFISCSKWPRHSIKGLSKLLIYYFVLTYTSQQHMRWALLLSPFYRLKTKSWGIEKTTYSRLHNRKKYSWNSNSSLSIPEPVLSPTCHASDLLFHIIQPNIILRTPPKRQLGASRTWTVKIKIPQL